MADNTNRKTVERQIALPTSKAVEIAWKNIRLRLSRSLVVTSGIVLAMAFLMYILATDSTVGAMRQWSYRAASTPEFQAAEKQVAELQPKVQDLADQIVKASSAVSADAKDFDEKDLFGKDFAQLQHDLGSLPVAPDEARKLLGAKPEFVATMQQWVSQTTELRAAKGLLNGPQNLVALMKAGGVPTTEKDIANNKVQTRWLIGLALLVAFAGILNAMLMSVTERFREIGTMKCLGALDSFIVKLFLIESVFQGGAGTIAGVVLGLLLNIIGVTSAYGAFAWKQFPYGDIAVAGVICLFVGVILTVGGAVYPAWRAARMHPIEAMRSEA